MPKITKKSTESSKVKKPKKITYSRAKKDLWKVFSMFIRFRGCLETTGTLDRGNCFTCETEYPYKLLQAGHFLAGRKMSILYDIRGVQIQCYHCNLGLKGNPIVYFRKMQKIYGNAIIEELEALNKTERKYKVAELLAMKEDFEKKIEELKNSV